MACIKCSGFGRVIRAGPRFGMSTGNPDPGYLNLKYLVFHISRNKPGFSVGQNLNVSFVELTIIFISYFDERNMPESNIE